MKSIAEAIVSFVEFTVWTVLVACAVVAVLYYGHVSQEVGLAEGKSNAVVACFEHVDTTAELEACSALKVGMGF